MPFTAAGLSGFGVAGLAFADVGLVGAPGVLASFAEAGDELALVVREGGLGELMVVLVLIVTVVVVVKMRAGAGLGARITGAVGSGGSGRVF